MRKLRVLLSIALVASAGLAGCKKKESAPPAPTAGSAGAGSAMAGSDHAGSGSAMAGSDHAGSAHAGSGSAAATGDAAANTTDSPIEGKMWTLADHTWKPLGSLPKGAEMAVLEGSPPFTEPKSFAILVKMPKNYTIPPHTHLVTERVTVLKGALDFGHGEKYDKKAMKELKVGGFVMMPANHAHFLTTKEETIVQLQGVGPWGIFYVDPKDDPRQPPPAKPENVDHPTDSEVQATELNLADAKWNPGPPSLPAGVEISVVEGAPPFGPGKSFVFRLKMPAGYKIPVHTHPVTERVTVLQGTLKFGMGDTWKDADMKPMTVGSEIYMPRDHKHFVQAEGETIVQLQGVGPWGITYVNPDEDPRNAKK